MNKLWDVDVDTPETEPEPSEDTSSGDSGNDTEGTEED